MKLSPITRAFALFTILFLAGYWFLVLPRLDSLGKLEQSLNELQAGVAKLSLRQSKAVAAPAGKDNPLQDEALQLLPSTDNQYDLSVQVEALSRDSGVVLASLSLNQDTGGSSSTAALVGNLKKVVLTVSVSGSYTQVEQFVIGLGKISRFIQVDQLTLNGGSDANNKITAQIVAFAYYLPAATPSK